MRAFFVSLAAAAAAVFAVPVAFSAAPRVLAVEFENDVNPVTQDYLTSAMERAEAGRYAAVVIVMDTPGGLDSSMRAIIKKQLALDVPVIVYVAPEGARAGSAGAFITMAADVAAMAPQTNIGSSTPVNVGGEDVRRDLRRKVVNDAAAYIRELAEEHGGSGTWAERFVRQGSNLGARDALERNVVDVVAPDLPTLLERVDGMRTEPKRLVLRTAGARIEQVEMSLWKRVLDTVIDPNIVVLLMSIGLLGLVIELWNPGLIFPGTVGAISLITGLYGLQVLPVSWAGILLMVLAAAFFVAEAFVVSHGALAVAGAVTFVFGALMLFDPAGDAYQVSIEVALGIALTLALLVGFAVAKVVQVRRRPVEVGTQRLVGDRGRVRRNGLVFVQGELWRARAVDGDVLVPGDEVEVESVEDDLVLRVRVVREPAAVP